MKKLLASLSFVLLIITTYAQDGFKCGNVELYHKFVTKHPEVINIEDQLEHFTKSYEQQNSSRDDSEPAFIIPIVFHIIHDNGSENISDAQIYDAVAQLNADFRRLNPDTINTIASFQNLAADSEIEFRLARKDPDGNCTNGIDRIVSEQTYIGNDDSKLNGWPNDMYLNIWVVKNLEGGAAGYSYYPSYGQINPAADGIILLDTCVGAIGTSTSSHAHVLSHEVGHYLNLRHCWGSTNNPGVSCGNDQVNDTPETKGWDYCNLNGSLCNTDVIENVQNFMEYSYCTTMFTGGQRTRMHATLNSTTAGRSNLSSEGNLFATGTNIDYSVCAPVPLIIPSGTKYVCVGDTLSFKGTTYKGPATSWVWIFPGGYPSFSYDSMPRVTYSTPGTYHVSLSVSNSSGSNSVTALDYVVVMPNTAAHPAVDFFEHFEGFTFAGNDDWAVASNDNDSWTVATGSGSSGVTSLKLDNQNSVAGEVDVFITPTFDLSTISNPLAYFNLAFAQRNEDNEDNLRIYASDDCGKTWKLRYGKLSDNINTTGTNISGDFAPNGSQWRHETINLTTFAGSPNVRLKFEFTHGGGNNIYIDDINFDPTSDVEKISTNPLSMSVFPNPASENEVALSFNLVEAGDAGVTLVSAEGRRIELLSPSRLQAGHQLLRFDLKNIPSGFYLVWLHNNGQAWSQPLVIKR